MTVTIPCDGYYSRALVSLSFALSPLWLGFYFIIEFHKNFFFVAGFPYIEISFAISTFVGLLLMRYAPSTSGAMALAVSVSDVD